MTAVLDTLFVYGTLMRAAATVMGRDERARLHCDAVLVGPAWVAGRLIDLGSYPGLIAPASADDRVYGEVLRLADPAGVFSWLDVYEGLVGTASVPERGEYERVPLPATLADGTAISAWTYRFIASADGYPLIAVGRWITDA